MTGVGVVRGQTTILRDVAWSVASDERWVVLGPNGSGKTTLLRIAGLYLHPSPARSRSSATVWARSTCAACGAARARV
jgi:ABC-type molybdenum transport system ATPase subunit/photorepair protein PhrA